MRAAIFAVMVLSKVADAEPLDDLTDVELEPISSSPCDDATAQLDPQHEATKPPRCRQLQQLAVAGLGTVELDRWSGSTISTGYVLVLLVRLPTETRFAVLGLWGGGCGAGTCVEYKPRSARLVRLGGSDRAFGVEVESTAEITHTFRDMGPPQSLPEDYRLACAARARVIDCKAIRLGGRSNDCRALGWDGTAVRYRCTGETQLVPGRAADTDGIPQADIERVAALLRDIDHTIAQNEYDCSELVKQLDKLLDREAEAIALARAIASPPGRLPGSLEHELFSSIRRLDGYGTCALDVPSQDALERLFHALGYASANFHLPPKP